jgi:hypothetical protein
MISNDLLICSVKAGAAGKGVVARQHGETACWLLGREPDWRKTTISRAGIVAWLESRGIRNGFSRDCLL